MNLHFPIMKIPPPLLCLRMWVLAWFVMALGAAAASPLLHSKTIEIVCAGVGATQMVVHTEGGTVKWNPHFLDCPLCLVSGVPPMAASSLAPVFGPLFHASAVLFISPVVAPTAVPPPARAPPFSLSHS